MEPFWLLAQTVQKVSLNSEESLGFGGVEVPFGMPFVAMPVDVAVTGRGGGVGVAVGARRGSVRCARRGSMIVNNEEDIINGWKRLCCC